MSLVQKIFSIALTLVIITNKANALELFYDSQTDDFLKSISSDLIEKSTLTDVKIYLAKSNEVNAFATSNKEIVLYSGLIKKAQNQEQVRGVIAHELGHLVANHHIKSVIKNQNNSLPSIAGTIIGLGAVIAGAPQAGYAAIVGGGAFGISQQLNYSREHENEADSIAIKLLKATDNDVSGLADFFAILKRQETNFLQKTPEFLNTHPSTNKRQSFVINSTTSKKEVTASNNFLAFKAKIFALTEPSNKVIAKYSTLANDNYIKHLAISIALLNNGEFTKSINSLNLAHKNGLQDKWYYDMLGQIKYQELEFKDSLSAYQKSVQNGNKSWIMDFQIAESYFENNPKSALNYYFNALAKFDEFSYTYKRIADCYAKLAKMAQAHYYFTLYYIKSQNTKQAKEHIKLALAFYKKENIDNSNLKFKLDELKKFLDKDSKD